MKNKTASVLEHLKSKGSITSWEAIALFKATRLSAIILNLKNRGHLIESVRYDCTNEDGDKTWYVRYFYKGDTNV